MSLQYTYVKERRHFGRPVKFFLRSEVLANYLPAKNEGKRFITKWTMDKSTEKRTQFAVASVNTENAEYASTGMFHVEGGFGKDIDINDEEQTLRYKKKLQRSEEYRIEMTRNLESTKKAVMQNAGVNIYENFFDSCADGANIIQCFRHPNPDFTCAATKTSFSIEQNPQIAVAYSHSVYDLQEENVSCPLIWDLIHNEYVELNCRSSCASLAFHKKYSNVISGGLQNGNVCLWDIRNATEPSIESSKNHQGFVTCLRWSQKCNYELLSGSSNGEVYWWDIRKMSAPAFVKFESNETEKKGSGTNDNLSIDSAEIQPLNKSACTAVEFDKLQSKYIRIGTADGRIISAQKNGNKIEKSHETKCHEDSVLAIAQNWSSYKCILTVDSGDIKVWDEEMKGDPLFMVSSIENDYCCGAWSLTRYSRFFIGKLDGSIQFWDLTFNHDEPYFVLQPTDSRVNDIQTNIYGTLMASCHKNGDVYVMKMADSVAGAVRDFAIEELNFETDL